MVGTLAREVPEYFKGTSNVLLAWKYNLTAIGTMAHEYLQTFQGVGVQLKEFQKKALEVWVQEYRGDLGIAVTDVVGMDAFLADFDLYFAKLFDGVRHDSGDPILWGEKAIAHYEKLKVTSCSITALTMLTGMAKPMPILPPSLDNIAELIPISSPFRFTSAPPELPGLIEASV